MKKIIFRVVEMAFLLIALVLCVNKYGGLVKLKSSVGLSDNEKKLAIFLMVLIIATFFLIVIYIIHILFSISKNKVERMPYDFDYEYEYKNYKNKKYSMYRVWKKQVKINYYNIKDDIEFYKYIERRKRYAYGERNMMQAIVFPLEIAIIPMYSSLAKGIGAEVIWGILILLMIIMAFLFIVLCIKENEKVYFYEDFIEEVFVKEALV